MALRKMLAALVAAPLAVQAQSNVQMYGVLDVAVQHSRQGNLGTARGVESGIMLGSRLGFRGTEDLGGGLAAVFVIEHGMNVDTGTVTSTSAFWNRRSAVGIQGRWGTVLLGRDYTPARFPVLNSDRMDFGLYGNLQTVTRVGGGAGTRIDNAIHFTSSSMNGFMVRAALGFGNERNSPPRNLGRFAGAALEYRGGPLYAGFGYNTRYDAVGQAATPTGSRRMHEAGGGVMYDFGAFSLNGGIFIVDPNGNNDVIRSWWIGAGVPVGSGRFLAQFGLTDPEGPGRATTYGIAYTHSLSKRTTLYAAHGKVNNNAQTAYGLNTSVPTISAGGNGGDPVGFALGIAHRF